MKETTNIRNFFSLTITTITITIILSTFLTTTNCQTRTTSPTRTKSTSETPTITSSNSETPTPFPTSSRSHTPYPSTTQTHSPYPSPSRSRSPYPSSSPSTSHSNSETPSETKTPSTTKSITRSITLSRSISVTTSRSITPSPTPTHSINIPGYNACNAIKVKSFPSFFEEYLPYGEEYNSDCYGGPSQKSQFFLIHPSSNITVLASTCFDTNFDTIIQAYSSNFCDQLGTCINFNDDGCYPTAQSSLALNLTAYQNYYYEVRAFGSSFGSSYTMNFTLISADYSFY